MTKPRILTGAVRDIEPNARDRRWEVYFDRSTYGADFPREHKAEIEVEWPSGVFRSTIGLTPDNPIYLHTAAVSDDARASTRVTDLCAKHGFGRAGPIRFEVAVPRRRFRVLV